MLIFNFVNTYITNPLVIVILAGMTVATNIYVGYWEKAFTRFAMMLCYVYLLFNPDVSEDVRRYLVRWAIVLLLAVDFTSFVMRDRILKQQHKDTTVLVNNIGKKE